MTVSNTWLNMSPPTDSEDSQSSPREIPRENLRNNSKEKLKNQEEQKKEKC
jgi:hypothetical protein